LAEVIDETKTTVTIAANSSARARSTIGWTGYILKELETFEAKISLTDTGLAT